MKRFFGTTEAIEETRRTAQKRGIFGIILAFVLVYLAGSLASGILLSIPEYSLLTNDEEFTEVLSSPSVSSDEILSATEEAIARLPEWFHALELITTVGVIAVCIIYCKRFENRRPFTLGFLKKGAVAEYFTGFGLGLCLLSAAFGIAMLSGGVKITGFSADASYPLILLFLLGYVVQGMSEEILLRGYLLVSVAGKYSVAAAVFTSSAMFSLLHCANPNITLLALINIFLFGILAALYFLRRGSIWGISALHTAWNFAQGNIFNISVSGISPGDSLIETSYLQDNSIIHGGNFGLEGGLAVTFVLILGIVALSLMKNKKILPPPFKAKGEFFSAPVNESDFRL